MTKKVVLPLLIAFGLALVGALTHIPTAEAAVQKITKEELKTQLDDPDVVILDVRLGKDWKASELKIKGAVRVDPRDLASVAEQYAKEKKLVLYCA